jgi:hypothetical protein
MPNGKLSMDHGDPVKLFLPYAVGWLGGPTRHALKRSERVSSSDQGGAWRQIQKHLPTENGRLVKFGELERVGF